MEEVMAVRVAYQELEWGQIIDWPPEYKYYDCILCPEYQPLRYVTTNQEGYREYKGDPRICADCPIRQRCTQSKDCVKTV